MLDEFMLNDRESRRLIHNLLDHHDGADRVACMWGEFFFAQKEFSRDKMIRELRKWCPPDRLADIVDSLIRKYGGDAEKKEQLIRVFPGEHRELQERSDTTVDWLDMMSRLGSE